MSEQGNEAKQSIPSCATCKFGQFLLGQPHRECRRYPPTPFPIINGSRVVGWTTSFPLVQPSIKCGEFVPSILAS